jgi:cold shock CspA family protein
MRKGTVTFIADNGIGFVKPDTIGGHEAVFTAHDAYDPNLFKEIQVGDVVIYDSPPGKLQTATDIQIMMRPENQVG